MKKSFCVSFLAVFLVACADSGQGTPASSESGTNSSSAITVHEPTPVASTGAVFEVPARPTPMPQEAAAKPQQIENAPSVNQPPVNQEAASDHGLNEQGSQTTPEPRTGDDANPDSVNPRQ